MKRHPHNRVISTQVRPLPVGPVPLTIKGRGMKTTPPAIRHPMEVCLPRRPQCQYCKLRSHVGNEYLPTRRLDNRNLQSGPCRCHHVPIYPENEKRMAHRLWASFANLRPVPTAPSILVQLPSLPDTQRGFGLVVNFMIVWV